MKNCRSLYLVLVFLSCSSLASANTPELSFEGNFNYTYSNVTSIGFLTLTGSLIGYQGLNSTPILQNSVFSLTSKFISATYGSEVIGQFGTSVTQISPFDFSIVGGDNTNLLQGSVSSLSLSGLNGFNFGLLSGNLEPFNGALYDSFTSSSSSLLGLVLNLSTPLSSNVFNSSFSGSVNGSLTAVAVSESDSVWLLLIGFSILLGSKIISKKITKKDMGNVSFNI